MPHVVESILACSATAFAGIWWLTEMKIVHDFKMKHPVVSCFIQSADDICKRQASEDLSRTIIRNIREATWQLLCRNLIQDRPLFQTMQALDTTEESASSATEPESKPNPAVVKSIPSSQTLMAAASGIVIVLGMGCLAANRLSGKQPNF